MANEKTRAKKEMSPARKQALNAVKNAKSDAEKRVAQQQLRIVRFKEIGSLRVTKLVNALDLMEQTLDASTYYWDSAQATKIKSVIESRVKKIMEALDKPAKRKQGAEKIEL